jgi:hypothetical protein
VLVVALLTSSKDSTHYLNNINRFYVSSTKAIRWDRIVCYTNSRRGPFCWKRQIRLYPYWVDLYLLLMLPSATYTGHIFILQLLSIMGYVYVDLKPSSYRSEWSWCIVYLKSCMRIHSITHGKLVTYGICSKSCLWNWKAMLQCSYPYTDIQFS